MSIKKVKIKNYRSIEDLEINFDPHLNIIVGDNESGKSTLLEAIQLALTGHLNGRHIYSELHPFIMNAEAFKNYLSALKEGNRQEPPRILIEVYFENATEYAHLKGRNNSLKEDSSGVSFVIEFDEKYSSEMNELVKNPDNLKVLPIEYYTVQWRSFAFDNITSRSIPLKPMFIDATSIKGNTGANKYLMDILKNFLGTEQRAQLSLSYRKMKDSFLEDEGVIKINQSLEEKKTGITDKKLTISLDSSSKSNWEYGIEAHVDDIPLSLAGKGEQNSIKIKLAMDSNEKANVFLIEEPENHLSHTNLNILLASISEKSNNRQLILTTHSSFVMNKLGINNVILISSNQEIMRLNDLDTETKDYFLKLPGHDTLRLVLSKKTILVEGPSDELIVHKAFLQSHSKTPLECGVEVICVNSLAFKRFLEISKILKVETFVITDNDGDVSGLKSKYSEFMEEECITILFDNDEAHETLEPQILKVNGISVLNKIFNTNHKTDGDILLYMKNNKTDCALKILLSEDRIEIPKYIQKAVSDE